MNIKFSSVWYFYSIRGLFKPCHHTGLLSNYVWNSKSWFREVKILPSFILLYLKYIIPFFHVYDSPSLSLLIFFYLCFINSDIPLLKFIRNRISKNCSSLLFFSISLCGNTLTIFLNSFTSYIIVIMLFHILLKQYRVLN